ncbi:SGNH/GDSL hydrolase family protein [Actinoplanes sp. NPDC023801]|uniref:SGNH/GDSL hydrolase family protein n=1 Tax=Actinoplanes sp. NPDC023801 TaxID=3154595 RepID=UPI0033C2740D
MGATFHRALTRRGLMLAGAGAAVVVGTPGKAGHGDPIHRLPVRVGTWAAAPTAVPAGKVLTLTGQTVRQVVHTSIGGDLPRVTLSNAYGAGPVRIGAASIGVRSGTGPSTDTVRARTRPLTFGGATEVVLQPGHAVTSDHADLIVEHGADLVISLYLPEGTQAGTISPRSKQTNLIVNGDATAVDRPGTGRRITRYLWLSGVSVRTVRNASAIVALGDSITCGTETTDNSNHRWPDLLSARLRAGAAPCPRGVLNVGLSGNRLLFGYEDPTGRADEKALIGAATLRRFDRDVLAQPGVRYVVTLIGVNDLANAPDVTVGQLIAGHRILIAQARSAGLTVYGGTLLPFGGAPQRYNNAANRAKRQELNDWIRGSGEYDAVIDFDAAVRDPAAPTRMQVRYDSGDGLHPNDLGSAALAMAVPLELFG